jgi:hypothetical protein
MSEYHEYEDFLEAKFDELSNSFDVAVADLASARAENKAMYERMDRMEAQHKETIAALRRELAEVMPDE